MKKIYLILGILFLISLVNVGADDVLYVPVSTPINLEVVVSSMHDLIEELFDKVTLLTITGPTIVQPGTTQTYVFDLTTTLPDSDYLDGTYQVQYASWALLDAKQVIVAEGIWEEVFGEYYREVMIPLPAIIKDYVLIGVITQTDMTYDLVKGMWITGEEVILHIEGIDLQTGAPVPVLPKPAGFMAFLAELWAWIISWFTW